MITRSHIMHLAAKAELSAKTPTTGQNGTDGTPPAPPLQPSLLSFHGQNGTEQDDTELPFHGQKRTDRDDTDDAVAFVLSRARETIARRKEQTETDTKQIRERNTYQQSGVEIVWTGEVSCPRKLTPEILEQAMRETCDRIRKAHGKKPVLGRYKERMRRKMIGNE